MNQNEFEYLKRAVDALGSSETTPMARVKILRTMEQIAGRCAVVIEREFQDRVDQNLANAHLVDLLKK